MSDPNALLMRTGVPAVKFPSKGHTVKGTVTGVDLQQQRDFRTKEPLFWDDDTPQMQIVVTLQTEERDSEIEHDDGSRKLYIRKQMQKAVRDAVVAAGASGLEVGGVLAVQWVDEKPSPTPGFNPSKVYAAQYRPPAASTNLLDTPAVVEPGNAVSATELI